MCPPILRSQVTRLSQRSGASGASGSVADQGRGTGKPPVLGARPPETQRSTIEARKKPGEPLKPAGPAIKLAPMPSVAQPAAPAAPAEPAAQKPDIKLPIDAIRASKSGAKPLQEHLRKHEEKRKAEAAAVKKGEAPPRRAPQELGQVAPSGGPGPSGSLQALPVPPRPHSRRTRSAHDADRRGVEHRLAGGEQGDHTAHAHDRHQYAEQSDGKRLLR